MDDGGVPGGTGKERGSLAARDGKESAATRAGSWHRCWAGESSTVMTPPSLAEVALSQIIGLLVIGKRVSSHQLAQAEGVGGMAEANESGEETLAYHLVGNAEKGS